MDKDAEFGIAEPLHFIRRRLCNDYGSGSGE
jgi:hypothetical protein